MTKDELKTAAKIMSDAGILIGVSDIISGGDFELEPDEVASYVEDYKQFFADLYKVSVETVREYLAYKKVAHQCSALTKNNKECRRRVYDYKTIHEFEKNRDRFCNSHSLLTVTEK